MLRCRQHRQTWLSSRCKNT